MYAGLPSAGRAGLPVAAEAADRILCLPLYPDLDPRVIARVIARIGSPTTGPGGGGGTLG
jgi:dTDP-4-amino-4,6-dideoxygalactose transaminase